MHGGMASESVARGRPAACRGALALAAAMLLAATAARAQGELRLCNHMSFIVDVALGFEANGTVTTRGWLRIEPGQCRALPQGIDGAEMLYLHARALSVYGASPVPQSGHADLCVGAEDFVITAARQCRGAGQRLARFTAARPSESEGGRMVRLAEEADYDLEQARLAAIQRLLVLAGYDAQPIDGIQGRKTEAALSQFLKDRRLTPETAHSPALFAALLEAAASPPGASFAWCNTTPFTVMAALGVEERGSIVTRGWFRVEAGRCLRPEVRGTPRRLYSYAEAIEASGEVAARDGRLLSWGGETILCTRNARFELSEHGDCSALGLTATGFAVVELAQQGPTTVSFSLP